MFKFLLSLVLQTNLKITIVVSQFRKCPPVIFFSLSLLIFFLSFLLLQILINHFIYFLSFFFFLSLFLFISFSPFFLLQFFLSLSFSSVFPLFSFSLFSFSDSSSVLSLFPPLLFYLAPSDSMYDLPASASG